MMRFGLVIFAWMTLATTAHAGTQEILDQSRALAEAKRYDEALELIAFEEKRAPENSELLMMKARILAWKGDYQAAQAILTPLRARYPNDDDILLVQAAIQGYEGRRDEATASYRSILVRNPNDADARQGLQRLEQAEIAAEGYRWQLDAGGEFSSFSRSSQDNWNQQFLQLSHFSPDRATTLHGQISRFDQFNRVDSYYELGASHRFTPRLNGYVLGGATHNADFRPDMRLGGGGEVRLDAPDSGSTAWWLTLDVQYDSYPTGDVALYNPSLRFEPTDGWAITARRIIVDPEANKRLYGWLARVDGTITNDWRFLVGYANAPETVAGVAVDTKTIFGGLAYDIDTAHTVRIGYTRDDRENSFIRDAVNVSVSHRF